MVSLRFIKVDFTLNLPVRCSGSLGFDPCKGLGRVLHVYFLPKICQFR